MTHWTQARIRRPEDSLHCTTINECSVNCITEFFITTNGHDVVCRGFWALYELYDSWRSLTCRRRSQRHFVHCSAEGKSLETCGTQQGKGLLESQPNQKGGQGLNPALQRRRVRETYRWKEEDLDKKLKLNFWTSAAAIGPVSPLGTGLTCFQTCPVNRHRFSILMVFISIIPTFCSLFNPHNELALK